MEELLPVGSPEPPPADTRLSSLQVPKSSDVLAGLLRQRILSGELALGMSLPVERELVAQSGLGRATVREALRILEIEGLIRTRPGRNGGTVVRQPNPASVTRSLEIFIRGRRLRLESLLEVREAVEPACAALAARHGTEVELAQLHRLDAAVEDSIDDVKAYLAANVNWHVAIGRMSHNELLGAFMEALATVMLAGTDIEDLNSDEVRAAAVRAHRRILEAIREHDPEAARRRMARHIRAYEAALMRSSHPDEVTLG